MSAPIGPVRQVSKYEKALLIRLKRAEAAEKRAQKQSDAFIAAVRKALKELDDGDDTEARVVLLRALDDAGVEP